MSTIKSDSEDLTLNAHGSGNDIKFQSNSVEVGSLTAEGVMTSTTFAGSGASLTNIPAAQITGTLPAISGANLTGVGVDGISSSADATAITISSSEQVGIGATPISTVTIGQTGGGNGNQLFFPYSGGSTDRSYSIGTSAYGWGELDINSSDANDTTIDRRILNVSRDGDVKIMTGDLIFGTAGKGICLGVTTNTDANTLDDYEEGTWVPTIVCSTSGSYVMDTGANLLAYTKVGRVVHIQGGCSTASESSPNGNIRMSLPFTPMTGTKDTDYCMGNATLTHHGGTLPNNANMFMSGGTTWVSLYSVADDGTTQYIDHNDVDTAWGIQFSMTYIAA